MLLKKQNVWESHEAITTREKANCGTSSERELTPMSCKLIFVAPNLISKMEVTK